jgi:hypothetical protein
MEAKLTGQNFGITAITPEQQAITGRDTTKWSWEIKPTKPGIFHLHLTLNVIIKLEGVSTPRAIRTFDKIITVNVTLGQKLSGFMKENRALIPVAITAIIIPLVVWLYSQFFGSK